MKTFGIDCNNNYSYLENFSLALQHRVFIVMKSMTFLKYCAMIAIMGCPLTMFCATGNTHVDTNCNFEVIGPANASLAFCDKEKRGVNTSRTIDILMSIPAAYGAFAAAIVALISNCVVSVHKANQDYKNAYRLRLAEVDANIGDAMYQMLACCKMYGIKLSHKGEFTGEKQRADFQKSMESWRARAEKHREILEEYRHKVRYVLYGVDEGFRTLSRVPGWLSHCLGKDSEIQALVDSADALRQEMDNVILYSYEKGGLPSWIMRRKVNIAAKRLRQAFTSSRPNSGHGFSDFE